MALTLEFNKGASHKMILMDRHKSRGHNIISRSKIFICANTLNKIAPFRNMHNNFKSDHQLKFWFRTPVSPWPVQCTQLHFSPPLRSLNRHKPAFLRHIPRSGKLTKRNVLPSEYSCGCHQFVFLVMEMWNFRQIWESLQLLQENMEKGKK